jgi:hypothetical protein
MPVSVMQMGGDRATTIGVGEQQSQQPGSYVRSALSRGRFGLNYTGHVCFLQRQLHLIYVERPQKPAIVSDLTAAE